MHLIWWWTTYFLVWLADKGQVDIIYDYTHVLFAIFEWKVQNLIGKGEIKWSNVSKIKCIQKGKTERMFWVSKTILCYFNIILTLFHFLLKIKTVTSWQKKNRFCLNTKTYICLLRYTILKIELNWTIDEYGPYAHFGHWILIIDPKPNKE